MVDICLLLIKYNITYVALINNMSDSPHVPLHLLFTDFDAGAPRRQCTQLVPRDARLLPHVARACRHAAIRPVQALDPFALRLLH